MLTKLYVPLFCVSRTVCMLVFRTNRFVRREGKSADSVATLDLYGTFQFRTFVFPLNFLFSLSVCVQGSMCRYLVLNNSFLL